MIGKILHFFLPKDTSENNPEARSDRIFIAIMIISCLGDLSNIPVVNRISLPVVAELLFANAVVSIVLLFLFKNGLSKKITAHIFIGQHGISFIFQTWLQGGVDSPALVSLFLLPAVIMLVLGKKDAIIWFIISLVIMISFFYYEKMNGPLPEQFDEGHEVTFYFTSVFALNVIIFLILLVYENGKNRAVKVLKERHDDLVATQQRLLISEKLASLGELTAGIAHEIQNPLNFVNNFSDLSIELAEELKVAFNDLNLSNKKAGYIEELLSDIINNQEKIYNHGRRADGIVKGMLKHSRGSSDKKELTDINMLADEYIRLAYHGLRANDKTFNAAIETDYDQRIQPINVVSEDIGRVILNLLTNAFYAVNEKAQQSHEEYKPTVWLITRLLEDKIQIIVRDNGNGIPKNIIDKIFQPFFTTKEPGKGTGLGLSITYDIITKAHGGQLKVNSEDGKFTEFLINLNI
jgi:signal transduction histidine kinase